MDSNIYYQVINMARIMNGNPAFVLFDGDSDIIINNQNYFHAVRRTTENSIFTFLTEKQGIQFKNILKKLSALPTDFSIDGKKVQLYGFHFDSRILILCLIIPDVALTKGEQETYKYLIIKDSPEKSLRVNFLESGFLDWCRLYSG
jgi:hypothetical protein